MPSTCRARFWVARSFESILIAWDPRTGSNCRAAGRSLPSGPHEGRRLLVCSNAKSGSALSGMGCRLSSPALTRDEQLFGAAENAARRRASCVTRPPLWGGETVDVERVVASTMRMTATTPSTCDAVAIIVPSCETSRRPRAGDAPRRRCAACPLSDPHHEPRRRRVNADSRPCVCRRQKPRHAERRSARRSHVAPCRCRSRHLGPS